MQNYKRLPLEGLKNARDLGGFGTPLGVTKFGVFIRSDVPSSLSAEDIEFLKRYNLKSVIDLRSQKECSAIPDALSQEDWLSYMNVPMYDEKAAKGVCTDDNEKFLWADHYIRLADTSKRWIFEVITALERARDCTLFHCATGKDRTGLVSMALLGLCGVSDEDIIADYSVSQIYLRPLYEKMLSEGKAKSLDDPFFCTAPENMSRLLQYINSEYGDIPSYLNSCGISNALMDSLKKRFISEKTIA
ncbi:MAG: tyrosine-protein phosphatase [Clostridiales bacterium]|jgi:protein-tyrosine phosphatase|nr:tyrosine-protein phosphatase [Clostridiales bacterium]